MYHSCSEVTYLLLDDYKKGEGNKDENTRHIFFTKKTTSFPVLGEKCFQ